MSVDNLTKLGDAFQHALLTSLFGPSICYDSDICVNNSLDNAHA